MKTASRRLAQWAAGLAVACLLAAPALAAPLPNAAHVQSAYEAARIVVEPGQHANDLLIQSATCRPLVVAGQQGPQAACQIDFVRRLEPDGRLYFDVVTLEERGSDHWALLAGLCMTRPADKHKAAVAAAKAAAGGTQPAR